MAFNAHILTLYPEMFPGFLGQSLAGKALQQEIWSCNPIQIRDFATGRHRNVDDTPSGGGAGMVMRADVLASAIDSTPAHLPRFLMSPRGKPFNQAMAHEIASLDGATFICGRFEGVDQRVIDQRNLQEISIGDYILSGGETAALVILDAIIRLLPGVMGNMESASIESFEADLLEHPHYTRPQEFEGIAIPDVLTSGNHKAINAWRQQQAENITRERRPDLWDKYCKNTSKA